MSAPTTSHEVNVGQGDDAVPETAVLLQKLVAEVQALNSNLSFFKNSHGLTQPPQHSWSGEIPKQQDAQENSSNNAEAAGLGVQLSQPRAPTQEELAMLECLPTPDLLLLIRRDLENAIGPCGCKIGGEPVSILSAGEYPIETHKVHWTFRNATLVMSTDAVSPGPLRFTLHSPSHLPTPDESAACLKFIQTHWPSDIVRATWKRYPVPIEADSEQDSCPFWGFSGSSHHSTFIHQLYAHSTAGGLQVQQPQMSYRLDEGMGLVRYLRVDRAGHSAASQPRGPGYVDIGQIWLITLGREVMDLKSAALVLSLLVRQQFQEADGGWADRLRFVHYRFLASYLCVWQLAREWLLRPFFFELNQVLRVAMINFSMRWLCPIEQLPGFVGFLLQRECGLLPKPAGRTPVVVREGRISLRFVSSFSIPPVFSTVILQDFPVDRSNLGPKLFDYSPNRMRVVGESSISILQRVLVSTLENTWYKGWMRLLDEIDDCVKVQPADVLDAKSAEGLMHDDSLAHSKLYFQLLQLLRIIPLWIRETVYDLEKLRNDCNGSICNPIPGLNHQPFLHTAEIIRQNWDEVLSRFHVLETELHRRIDAKTDEIRGLRDGLFSASSLQEAHKATSMNRYIIIFTTVTIFYLPPAFVTMRPKLPSGT